MLCCVLADEIAAAKRIQLATMRHFTRRTQRVLCMFANMASAHDDSQEARRELYTKETTHMYQERAYFDKWVVDMRWWHPMCCVKYCMQSEPYLRRYAENYDQPCAYCLRKCMEWSMENSGDDYEPMLDDDECMSCSDEESACPAC